MLIAALEDCGNAAAPLSLFVSSLWSQQDDLCEGVSRLHSLVRGGGGGSVDDEIELLRKLLSLQTSSPSGPAVASLQFGPGSFSLEAASTAMLLEETYEAKAQQQQQQQSDVSERITMLSRALQYYENRQHGNEHEHKHKQRVVDILVRLHRHHAAAGSARESLACIERAVQLHSDTQQQQHNITALRVMLFNAFMKMNETEQVFTSFFVMCLPADDASLMLEYCHIIAYFCC
jgi:hypothetical protein